MIDHAEFTVTHFRIRENDRLVLASDGNVEAMDEQAVSSDLNDFRSYCRAGSRPPKSPPPPKPFGQQDDISVIAVTCGPALVPA